MKYIYAAVPNDSAPKSDGDLHKLFWLKRLLFEMISYLWQATVANKISLLSDEN